MVSTRFSAPNTSSSMRGHAVDILASDLKKEAARVGKQGPASMSLRGARHPDRNEYRPCSHP